MTDINPEGKKRGTSDISLGKKSHNPICKDPQALLRLGEHLVINKDYLLHLI